MPEDRRYSNILTHIPGAEEQDRAVGLNPKEIQAIPNKIHLKRAIPPSELTNKQLKERISLKETEVDAIEVGRLLAPTRLTKNNNLVAILDVGQLEI